MSYLEYQVKYVPTGLSKLLHFHWAIALLLTAVASLGFLMLYSVAGGSWQPWAMPQIERYALGFALMVGVGMVPIWFWRNLSVLTYLASLGLLALVEVIGVEVNGSTRWIDVGIRLQPSELMKIASVMVLAAYYDWLPFDRKSRPFWVLVPAIIILIPVFFVVQQPDLGTSLLLLLGGAAVMFFAGVHWAYFVGVFLSGIGAIYAVLLTKGTERQILKDYQYDRIETFMNPAAQPLGDGYHITQAKIALGSGGWTGKGFMQGTQSRLNFLPEKHTDFIFNTLAEEFGFMGSVGLLMLYTLIIVFCVASAVTNKDRFASLLTLGVAMTLFLYFAVNMAMVMGLLPVVGVPLPLVSYGGSAMLVLMGAFGLVQSAHIHRPR